MKVYLCDMCKKPLGEEYYHIPVMKARFKIAGWGKMLTRIGGAHLCESCAFGIAGVVNGDEELKNVRRHRTDMDPAEVLKLADDGMTVREIVKKLGYNETSVRRILKKAAPK